MAKTHLYHVPLPRILAVVAAPAAGRGPPRGGGEGAAAADAGAQVPCQLHQSLARVACG